MKNTLEILNKATKSQESYEKHKNSPEIDIELVDAYIEMKFIYKLYEYVENLLKDNRYEYKIIDYDTTIEHSFTDEVLMKNIQKIQQQRQKRQDPIKIEKGEELLDLGMVGFSFEFIDNGRNSSIHVMSTTKGLLLNEDTYFKDQLPTFDISAGFLEHDIKIDPKAFEPKHIGKFLDEVYMQEVVDVVMKDMFVYER